MNFDLDKKTRRELGYRLIDLINDYYASLPERSVQLPLDNRKFPDLRDKMPEIASDAVLVLDDIFHELTDKGFHIPSANYFGLINPTPTYMAVIAEALVATLNPQLASLARSQMASRIEHETIGWIAQRIGWNPPNLCGDGSSTRPTGVPHPSRREGALRTELDPVRPSRHQVRTLNFLRQLRQVLQRFRNVHARNRAMHQGSDERPPAVVSPARRPTGHLHAIRAGTLALAAGNEQVVADHCDRCRIPFGGDEAHKLGTSKTA